MARLAVVLGDPTGIGPEVLVKALADPPPAAFLLIGDSAVWADAQRVAGIDCPAQPAERPGPVTAVGIPFLESPVGERSWRVGAMSPAAGRAAATWLALAVRLAAAGSADAVVFAPVHKEAIIRAGYPVRDEYDLCASLAGVQDYDEMNVIPHPRGSGLLWVARVTSHVPLREVAPLLTTERVLRTIRLAHRVAQEAGPTAPVIGVAALNPHAGEGGLLGEEEIHVIHPAVEAAVGNGIAASGPYPADQIFRLARAGRLDAVVSMYHDQAQIATKLLGFERGVSVGVGYPFVLVTPSHGTAFDIAGKGVADSGPMRQALLLAVRLADGRTNSASR